MGEDLNTNPGSASGHRSKARTKAGAKARTKAGSEADTFRNHSGSADRKR